MKIIERYISAYIVNCLFPISDAIDQEQRNSHMNYVYEVLRETGSKSSHPLLNQVLDFVRQSDPSDPATQRDVRDYVMAQLANGAGKNAEQPKLENAPFIAMYSLDEDLDKALFSLYENKDNDIHFIGIATCPISQIEICKKKVAEKLPGVVFQKV